MTASRTQGSDTHGVKRRGLQQRIIERLTRIDTRWLPFAEAASAGLPWTRLLRLSLFQCSVGMALVLLNGTLNRVMIVELGVPAWLVAVMVSLPLLFAPFRALIGFRSDKHRSAIGWRRVPYLWFGSLLMFGGLAIMPFALLLLSAQSSAPAVVSQGAAALAFLLVGVGMHTTQTAGLALATDLADERARPQVVAVLYVTLLLGMLVSALLFGALLENYSHTRLVQVVQGAAMVAIGLNMLALWKQETRRPWPARNNADDESAEAASFLDTWRHFAEHTPARRFLVAVMLGTAAFSMQDILLEPYGGQILHLSVAHTTQLTALLAGGSLIAFVLAGRLLQLNHHPVRLAALGLLSGIVAFCMVIFADPLRSIELFRLGVLLIGFGAGLFAVTTLVVAMSMCTSQQAGQNTGQFAGQFAGLSLGAWGAAQATAAGVGIALGGLIRDGVSHLAVSGALGPALQSSATGYSVVYHLEIALLFATLVALGPLVSRVSAGVSEGVPGRRSFGLAAFPD